MHACIHDLAKKMAIICGLKDFETEVPKHNSNQYYPFFHNHQKKENSLRREKSEGKECKSQNKAI